MVRRTHRFLEVLTLTARIGIGLLMATALENNGATVYIIGRRMHLLEKAAKENSVRACFSQ